MSGHGLSPWHVTSWNPSIRPPTPPSESELRGYLGLLEGVRSEERRAVVVATDAGAASGWDVCRHGGFTTTIVYARQRKMGERQMTYAYPKFE